MGRRDVALRVLRGGMPPLVVFPARAFSLVPGLVGASEGGVVALEALIVAPGLGVGRVEVGLGRLAPHSVADGR